MAFPPMLSLEHQLKPSTTQECVTLQKGTWKAYNTHDTFGSATITFHNETLIIFAKDRTLARYTAQNQSLQQWMNSNDVKCIKLTNNMPLVLNNFHFKSILLRKNLKQWIMVKDMIEHLNFDRCVKSNYDFGGV